MTTKITSFIGRAAMMLLIMLLTAMTAWATDYNITTNITYNGLTASDVTFTLSGNGTSFDLVNGETKSVGDIFPDATFTITCNNPQNYDIEVSYSGSFKRFGSAPLSPTPNGNGCSFNWSFMDGDLTLNITVIPGEAPQEGITITQNGSVNMPVSGDITVNIPDGVTKFYVYDDGGPSGNFSDGCNGQVLLIAPEGKLLKVNGTVTGGIYLEGHVLEYAILAVYDGSSTSATMLFRSPYGSVSNITSSCKQMLLHFYDTNNVKTETAAGFSLTVEVVEPTTHSVTIADGITHGTVTADKTSAMTGETVTLTVTPDVGYELENITGVTVTSIGNNQYTFIMPDEDVTISASIHVSSLFGYKYEYGDILNNYIPDGSADYPYIISSADGWNLFCDCLAEENNTTWNRFSGKTVKLDADIAVSRMAGSGDNPFCGNFDGGGNTLTFTATAADNYCAPFVGVKGGTTADDATTISNLNVVTTITANDYRHMAGLIALQWGHVNVSGCNATVNISSTVGTSNPHDLYPAALVSQASSSDGGTLTVTGCTASGTISTDGKYAAGLVGIVQGTASITDCISSVTIDSSTSGDGTHGGIVAVVTGSGSIEGCVFNGKLLSKNTGNDATTNCAGFVAWGNGTISNCLYAPANIDTEHGETEVLTGDVNNYPSGTFYRGTAPTVSNCYYTRTLGTAQGKAPHTVTPGADVTIEAVALSGDETHYAVSGITAYANGGLQRGQTLYYGSGDQLSLTLSNSATGAPDGYRYDGYTASAGTLSGTTLTMPDEDVTISVNTAVITLVDWATEGNSGESEEQAFMIYNKEQFDLLAQRVNSGTGDDYAASGYSGKYFKLGADIGTSEQPVTSMVGSEGHAFCGTFDGGGHTLTVSISNSNGNAAPFREIMGATIRNLKVCGTVSGHKHSAGLVSYARGADSSVENTIENCLVATDVSTIVDTDDDCYLGGIVGHGFNCKLTIRGCAFTGSLTSPHNYTGGLQGWSDGNTLILENDIFAASSVNAANVGFHPIAFHVNNATTTATVTNVYYTVAPTCTTASRIAAAGKAVRSVTAGTDVILYSPGPLNNTNTYYNVSGIRAYTTGGLYYNHNLYYGSGDRLSILLENTRDDEPLGYRYTYAFSGGTADEYEYSADYGGTSYHLTMPDQDVTVNVDTETLRSTGQAVSVSYVDADGKEQIAQAIALDGHEAVDGDGDVRLAGTYYVGTGTLNYTHGITLTGNVTLILADNCQMNVGTSSARIESSGIISTNGSTLTVTSQSLGNDMGALDIYNTGGHNIAICASAITINGGSVTADTDGEGSTAFYTNGTDLTINGGTVSANTTGSGASALAAYRNFIYNGGNVTATAPNANAISAYGNYTFSWRNAADRITIGATGLYVTNGTTATFTKAMTDGTTAYSTTLTGDELNALKDKTLQPCAVATFAPEGFATYYHGMFDVTLPEGVKARIVTARVDDEGTLTYQTIADGDTDAKVVPAGTAVMLQTAKSTQSQQKTLLFGIHGNNSPAAPAANFLHGSDTEGLTTGDGKHYKLSYDTQGNDIGWYWGAADGAAFQSGAHKAWLVLPDGANARFFTLPDYDDATSLREKGIVKSEKFTTAQWYTLDGRKLSDKPTKAGLYINNGHKVVIK